MHDAVRLFRVMNVIGIIDQLATTLANRRLESAGLPWHQFVLLNHFSHRPAEPRTVTGIAAAFQQPQPGITKTVQRLLERGWLRAEPDPDDRRSKRLYLTEAGADAHCRARALLAPELAAIFRDWTGDEVDRLLPLLERLRVHLDTHRGGAVSPAAG